VSTEAPRLKIVFVGHVDHGKSTLVGRLLADTGTLGDGKLEKVQATCRRQGKVFEYAFLLDALEEEQGQGITIDAARVFFKSTQRDYLLLDAPGHSEFLRNMITGAAQADAAILVVDATEGVRDQTRRHGYLLQLLGIQQVVVVINKMDRIDYDATRFREIETEITDYLKSLGLTPTEVIPVSAREGVGITEHTYTIEWYRPTVVEALDKLAPARTAPELPLRFPVQAIYKFDDRRILAGRVETGRIAVGDEVVALPSGATTRVKSIEAWPAGKRDHSPDEATAGQSIGVTLNDPLFIERGNLISRSDAPARTGSRLRARVFWLHASALEAGARIGVSVGTAEARGVVTAIHHAVDPGLLAAIESPSIAGNHVGEIEVTLDRPIACDPYESNPVIGRVVLEYDGRIAGGGLVLEIGSGTAAVTAPAVPSHRPAQPGELESHAARLAASLAPLSPAERIARLRQDVAGKITFTTSFGPEDQAILHWLSLLQADIDVVTLDTGRLFSETYALWAETERRYGRRIRAFYPHHEKLDGLVARQGINGFYESKAARLACCHVRKVEPLNRALAGAKAWITGLRGDQSAHRAGMGVVEADAERGLLKLNPLFDWAQEAVLAFVRDNGIPTNPLHAKGFASIGCAPCTRAIAPGEPERAGRWWWEQQDKKECGLHVRDPARSAAAR